MMANVKRFIVECLRPLWWSFFLRSSTINRNLERLNRQQRLRLVVRSFLVAVTTLIVLGLILRLFGIHSDFTGMMTLAAAYVVFGIVVGIFDLADGIALGVSGILLGGVAFGIAEGLAYGIAVGSVISLIRGAPFSIAFGISRGIMISVAFGIAGGIGVAIAGGITKGIWGGVAVTASALRLPFLLIGLLTTLWSLAKIRRTPNQVSRLLSLSLVYQDEQTFLPQPYFAQLIVAVGEQDKEAAQKAITHLTTNTYQQRVAKVAWLELGSRELLTRHTVEEIGNLAPTSFWLSSIRDETIEQQQWSAAEAFARCQKIAAEIRSGVSASSDYNKRLAFDGARRQLEELRQMAVLVLRGRESQTFARIAQQWLDVVNAEIERLTAEERVAERIPNPYIAPNPLTAGTETFVGRDNAFRSVEEHFLRSAESAPMVLFGQPRIGKTSLLRNLDKRLPTNLIPIYVDMQRSGLVESTAQLLVNLAKAISQGLAARGFRIRQLSANDLAAEPFSVFDNFLDEVEQAIGATERREAHRLILALDEFEVIEQKLTEGKVSRDLMPYLRSVMQHRRGLSLLFAGTHTLDEMVAELWIPYFRSAVPQRVSYLGEAAARKLVTNPIENFPLDYEPVAGDRLIAETRCHPCLIQLTCSALVDAQNARKSHHATVEDVEEALDKVLKLDGRYVFEGIWNWIPAEERTLLMFIATHEPATIAQAAQALTTPTARISGSVERLIDAEVLEPAEEREEFRFQVPLFRRWVARQAARAGMEWEAPRPVAS